LKDSFYHYSAKGIDGKDVPMSEYQGKVVLVVNVASKCGYTPQYKDLQALYEKYKEKGFMVLGFPCNQFMFQEPGDDAAIKDFACGRYKVSFPLFSKISVNGTETHPIYQYLRAQPNAEGWIKWNFTKFLVGRDGKVIYRYGVKTKPLEFEKDIEVALAAAPVDDKTVAASSAAKPATGLNALAAKVSQDDSSVDPPHASTL